MSGVLKIKIAESVEELKMLMKQQKTGLGYAKIQSLYLLKISAVETVRHLAIIIGRGESTIHRWLHQSSLPSQIIACLIEGGFEQARGTP